MTTTSAERITDPIYSHENHQREIARIGAVHVLAMNRQSYPQLVRAEAQARLDMAVAVIAMDEIDVRVATGEKIHNLQEQASVEMASHAYLQALANLVRGELPEDEA